MCGIKTSLQSDIEDSSACSIIYYESDIDVIVPVSAGAHDTRVNKK